MKQIISGINSSTLILAGLGCAVVSASAFIISESGHFFTSWYPGAEYKGYFAAGLLEVFLAIAAAAHFQGRKGLNRVVKTIMVFLFVSVLAGASFNLIVPMLKEYHRIKQHHKLVVFLEAEHKQNQAALEAVKGQKINTALAIKQQKESNRQYKEELKKETNSPWAVLSVLVMTVFMRFALQTTNLVFAYSFGILWRGEKRRIKRRKKSVSASGNKQPTLVKMRKVVN